MFFVEDFAHIGVRAAWHPGRACLVGVFESLITGDTLAGRPTGRVRGIASALFEQRAFRTDVLGFFGYSFEISAAPAAGLMARFVQHRLTG